MEETHSEISKALTGENVDPTILENAPVEGKKKSVLALLKEYKPILLFLPLILLISSDEVTLIVNQVLIVIEFRLENRMSLFGALLGVSQIVKAVSTLSFGFMADKFQRKKLLLVSSTGWAIGNILVGFATDFWLVFVFRVFATACAGAASSVTLSLLADLFSSEDRGYSFAIWGAITTIGVAVGASIASIFNRVDTSFSVDAVDFSARIQDLRAINAPELVRYSWQMPFRTFGFLGLVCILIASFLKEPKRAAKEKVLQDLLAHEDMQYDKFYNIKGSDLKYIWERKTNFFLIINFLDTVLTGLIVGSLILWLTVELGFNLENPASWGYLLALMLPIGLLGIFGMFYFPKRGDKIVKSGDIAGRVKVAIFCGFLHIPFLIVGFLFIPDARLLTFFKGALQTSPVTFTLLLIVMGIIVGIGVALMLPIGAVHYASMIDVNYPEHRSTMIASAAFIDAFGRAIGAWAGLAIADYYNNQIHSPTPISDAILFSILTFGVGSALMWLPIYKYAQKDIASVNETLKRSKAQMEKYYEELKQNDENKKE